MSEQPKLTYGQKACGVNFNPDGSPQAAQVKQLYASLVDLLDAIRQTADNSPEVKRMLSLSITDAQTSQMWAVKAITWRHE
jgi:hypothetical protein